MNTKIFALLTENLQTAFKLPKYADLVFDAHTCVDRLPWTPARFRKFKATIESALGFDCEFDGTVQELVDRFDRRYLHVFFGEIWKPRTGDYNYTGWQLADEINQHAPKNVLDVGVQSTSTVVTILNSGLHTVSTCWHPEGDFILGLILAYSGKMARGLISLLGILLWSKNLKSNTIYD
jgi:hypothetical protein